MGAERCPARPVKNSLLRTRRLPVSARSPRRALEQRPNLRCAAHPPPPARDTAAAARRAAPPLTGCGATDAATTAAAVLGACTVLQLQLNDDGTVSVLSVPSNSATTSGAVDTTKSAAVGTNSNSTAA